MSTELQALEEDTDVGSTSEPARATEGQDEPQPSEFSQWTVLILSMVIILLSFLMSAPGEEQVYLPGTSVPLPGLCVTRSAMGIDCPGCGLTRCFISLAHGQFVRAWHFNPAGFLFYAVVVVQIPLRLVQILRIRSGRDVLKSPIFYWAIAAIAISLLLQWAVKMCLLLI